MIFEKGFRTTICPQIEDLSLEFDIKLAGDYMFLAKAMGHMGPSSVFKCFICTETNMGSSQHRPHRTLRQITDCAVEFKAKWDNNQTRSRQLTKLSRMSESIEHCPIFCIEPKNIIPGSLHCIMGQCKGLVGILQSYIKRCDEFCPQLEGSWALKFDKVLRDIGLFPATWFQTFSGRSIN